MSIVYQFGCSIPLKGTIVYLSIINKFGIQYGRAQEGIHPFKVFSSQDSPELDFKSPWFQIEHGPYMQRFYTKYIHPSKKQTKRGVK